MDEDFVSFRALEKQILSFLIYIKVFFYYLYNNFHKCAILTKNCTHLEFLLVLKTEKSKCKRHRREHDTTSALEGNNQQTLSFYLRIMLQAQLLQCHRVNRRQIPHQKSLSQQTLSFHPFSPLVTKRLNSVTSRKREEKAATIDVCGFEGIKGQDRKR